LTPAFASSCPVTVGDDAGHLGGGARVDRDDARVRIRRAQEQHVCLARGVHVVGKTSPSGEEAFVLDAEHRFSAAEATVLR
jgi:hypothetical protein